MTATANERDQTRSPTRIGITDVEASAGGTTPVGFPLTEVTTVPNATPPPVVVVVRGNNSLMMSGGTTTAAVSLAPVVEEEIEDEGAIMMSKRDEQLVRSESPHSPHYLVTSDGRVKGKGKEREGSIIIEEEEMDDEEFMLGDADLAWLGPHIQ